MRLYEGERRPKRLAQGMLNDSMNRFLSAYHQTVMVLEAMEGLTREEAEATVQEVVAEKRSAWEAECLGELKSTTLEELKRLL